jgi:GAF domain-containing protein
VDPTGGTRPPPLDVAQRLHELETLYESLRTISSTLDLGDLVRKVLDAIRTVTDAEALSLLLYDAEREELVFAVTETLEERALASRESPLPPAVGALMSPERLIVPVRDQERVLGVIDLRGRYDGRQFDDADAQRAAVVAAELASRHDLEDLAHDPAGLRAVFTRLAAAVPSEDAALVVYGRDRRELAFRVSHALRHGLIDGARLPIGQGIAGWVAEHRRAVRLDDASRDPRHDPQIARRTGLVPHSMICMPMVHADRLHGVIQVINKLDGSAFDDDELRLMQTLADHAARALDALSGPR